MSVICEFKTALVEIVYSPRMTTPKKSPWYISLKEWVGPIASILGIVTALGIGLQYIINSELKGISNSINSVKTDVEDLKNKSLPDITKRLEGTNTRIDGLLSDALKRAFSQSGKNATTAALETGAAIVGAAHKAGVTLDHQTVSEFSMALASRLKGNNVPPQLWASASEVINYRSIGLPGSPPNCFSTRLGAERFPRVQTTIFENCQIDLSAELPFPLAYALNHYSRDHMEIRHCKVTYQGGQVALFALVPKVIFVNCQFLVSPTSVPQGSGKNLIAHLLSVDNQGSTVFDADSGA